MAHKGEAIPRLAEERSEGRWGLAQTDEGSFRSAAPAARDYVPFADGEQAEALRVLIGDSQTLFRAGFRRLVSELFPGTALIETSSTAEAWKVLNKHDGFDLVLLDLAMPGVHDGPGIRRFVEKDPSVPVVVLAAQARPEEIAACMERGARGYIPKTVSEDVLRHALALVLAGEIYLPRSAIRQILSDTSDKDSSALDDLPETNPLRQLTPRQRSTLSLIVDGRSNKEIARSLNLLESTVKAHVKVILRKLSASNRTQAALIAADLGWPRRSGSPLP